MKRFFLFLASLFLATAVPAAAEKGLTGRLHLSDCIAGGENAIRSAALELAAANPELEISIEKLDIPAALAKLDAGETDLVLAAEPLPDSAAAKAEVRRYAAVAALLFVNAANEKRDFSTAELRRIFTGELDSWQSLNGGDYTLHRLALQSGRPAERLFREKILGGRKYTDEIYRKPDSAQLLILTSGNPNAIALTGYPGQEVDGNLLAAAVDGVAPTLENLKSGKYPLLAFRVLILPKPRPAALSELLRRIEAVNFRTALQKEELFAL